MKPLHLIATCARGLELLLAEELQQLFAQDVIAGDRIVSFAASPEIVYRVLLGTRLANRILWPVCTVPASDADELYRELCRVDWSSHLNPSLTFCVDFIGESPAFRNTMFGALKVKDALVDSTRRGVERASVSKDDPDVRFNAVLLSDRKLGDRVQVSIDLANGSLHRRGYRQQAGEAPLKETLAAALLLGAGWPAIAQAGGALFDPFCGSGTLLIEAALMAADIAPGVYRPAWGFAHCPWHDEQLWQTLLQAQRLRLRQLDAAQLPAISGSDVLPEVIRKATGNIQRAGLQSWLRVSIASMEKTALPQQTHGLLISNPPYGERLDDDPDLPALYARLGEKIAPLHGWQAAILTSDKLLAQAMGLRSHKSYRFDNGQIACRLYLFTLDERNHFKPNLVRQKSSVCAVDSLPDGARMLYNRLQKNQQRLSGWLKQENISCYRLYDADLPEYAVAVDVYEGRVHLQEYMPPKTIDEAVAKRRCDEAVLAVSAALDVPMAAIQLKRRMRQRGEQQYRKQVVEDHAATRFLVHEHGHAFWVDLQTYLDTGLFLDTRPVREMIGTLDAGKCFLNLFCYTASATVYAAKAGAASSVSVDLSNTYIEWARENFIANGIDTRKHRLVREDCLQWLQECREQFDLIYLDPPTFSNSKSMQGTLDVQRDQLDLITSALRLLADDGMLVFVTNHQRFRMQQEALAEQGWQLRNITAQTIDRDFQRSQKIHQCWLIGRQLLL